MNADTNTKIELAVDMKSPCCAKKVESALQDFVGVKSVTVNAGRQTVVIEGNVIAEEVKSAIENKTGMYAAVMGFGSSLGSAVAAIAISDVQVRGIIRMTQANEETSVIEGSLDGLPSSKNLFVALHKTGDLSDGCNSCGPPFCNDDNTNECIGIISQLKPDSDQSSAHFRCTSSNLKVQDMYGRCIVVHEGDQEAIKNDKSSRLACGIVARSSVMFENSKRFCACDGVTIWEEKKNNKNAPQC